MYLCVGICKNSYCMLLLVYTHGWCGGQVASIDYARPVVKSCMPLHVLRWTRNSTHDPYQQAPQGNRSDNRLK